MPWSYILRCQDGSFYVGSTRDLDVRMQQHASGMGGAYTARRLPVELLWAMEFERIDEAWEMERRVQGWSRAKRQALIDGRLNDLPALSARRTRRRGGQR